MQMNFPGLMYHIRYSWNFHSYNFRSIFGENKICSKSETAYFYALFIKKYIQKESITFIKLKKQNVVMCTRIVLVPQESRMYHIRYSWVFQLSFKMTEMHIQLHCTAMARYTLISINQ